MSKLLKLAIVSSSLIFGSVALAADETQQPATTDQSATAATTPAEQTTAPVATAEKAPALVNINEADAKALMAVKGIDSKMAKEIVEYRTKNGNFTSVEDLIKVKGMTKSLYNKISKHLTV